MDKLVPVPEIKSAQAVLSSTASQLDQIAENLSNSGLENIKVLALSVSLKTAIENLETAIVLINSLRGSVAVK